MEEFNGINSRPAVLRSFLGNGYIPLFTRLYLWQRFKREYQMEPFDYRPCNCY